MLKIKPFFRWYDLWVGVFIDTDKDEIYICPVPMFGVRVKFFKVIRWRRWQVLLASHFWLGSNTFPDLVYPVFRWWHIGPIEIRKFLVGPDAR